MIVSQPQSKCDEQLVATPILSNVTVPGDLTLDGLDRFVLDSPASALTELSSTPNSSSCDNCPKPKSAFRFSCPDEEPIVVPLSRFTTHHVDPQRRENKRGLSRSKSPNDSKRRNRIDNLSPPLSFLSSIAGLTTKSSNSNMGECDNNENALFHGKVSHLTIARNIFSCWARDFSIEVLRRINANTVLWLLPNSTQRTWKEMNNAIMPTTGGTLSTYQEFQVHWNRQKMHRNRSSQRRRKRPVCISGLPNQGQTCFLNSVLQSLASLEPFMEYLEGIVEYQEEKEHIYLSSTFSSDSTSNQSTSRYYSRLLFGNRIEKHAPINHSLSSFSKELFEILQGINRKEGEILEDDETRDISSFRRRRRFRRRKLNPKILLTKIANSNPQFSSYGRYEQQDAQELFASLMGVVIQDSHLDNSSSDRRLETLTRHNAGMENEENDNNATMKFNFENIQDSGPMTSALAHSKDETPPRVSTLSREVGSSLKLLNDNQVAMGSIYKDDDGENINGKANILSLSGFLEQISKERNKVLYESNRLVQGLETPNYRKNFLEEKKQEQGDFIDISSTAVTSAAAFNWSQDGNRGCRKQKCRKGIISQGSRLVGGLSKGRRLMRSTMSPMTPSPLSGWLGSTLQCSKCKHVRPIQNSPFLDIPLVPTSVPNYLSRAYQKASTKHSPPNLSRIPSCSLEKCLENFTSIENVDDVECRSCTILEEIDRLEEEATMLKGAVETTERRILSKRRGAILNNRNMDTNDSNTLELESFEGTKYLREDLFKVETRLSKLRMEDPDQDDDGNHSLSVDDSNNTDNIFFGTVNPLGKAPIQRHEAKKCLLLTRTPSVLCCHIQRRYYDPLTGKMEKCVQFVEFPEFLDLSPFCAYGPRAITPWAAGSLPKSQRIPTNISRQPPLSWSHTFSPNTTEGGTHEGMPYHLKSVIEHRGNAFGGHYVSYRRDHTGSWFCISDNIVSPVRWQDVQSCQAYMLFYEAI